ncbi:MAG: phage head-tail connector protein [Pseudomonadota bacterium]
MPLSLVTAPAVEPISLAEAKTHIRIDHEHEDLYIQALIVSVRVRFEATLNRALITQTWALLLDDWPLYGLAEIVPAPVQSISSVTVKTPNGTQTVAPTAYQLDGVSTPARLKFTGPLPTTDGSLNAITIEFLTGFGATAANLPADIRHAMLFTLAHWYEHRDPMYGDDVARAIPPAAEELLAPYSEVRL